MITEEQVKKILELEKKGVVAGRIAQRVHLSKEVVEQVLSDPPKYNSLPASENKEIKKQDTADLVASTEKVEVKLNNIDPQNVHLHIAARTDLTAEQKKKLLANFK